MSKIIPVEIIEKMIYLIRGQKVMIDVHLAELYGVKTKELNKAVKRNNDRFPDDFMFQLTRKEFEYLRFQIGTSSWGGRRYLPLVFTEQGVAMLSSVLNSKRAIQVNIHIMRTFVKLRYLIASHKGLLRKIDAMESKYDRQFKIVFDAIRKMLSVEKKPKKRIGFITE